MHVHLAAACPQCRSTTLVVTNQDDVWGKDHAINCGVYGRRVIAAGLTGKGLRGTARWTRRLGAISCGTLLREGSILSPWQRVTADVGRAGLPPPPLSSTMPGGLPAVWPRGESRTGAPRPGVGAGMRRLS